MTEENMSRLIAALKPIRPVFRADPRRLPMPSDPKHLVGFNNMIMVTDLGEFDVPATVDPIGTFDDLLKHSSPMLVEGRTALVLNIDPLIAAKKAAGRDKDKLGVLHLESAKKRREQTGRQP